MNSFWISNASKACGTFSNAHIMTILSYIVFIFIIAKKSSCKKDNVEKVIKVIAIFSILMDPIYWIWQYCTQGVVRPESALPFYFCSLYWLLIPFVAFSKKNTKRYRCAVSWICSLGIVCGINGIVFNFHFDNCQFLSFEIFHTIIYHFLMLAVPTMLISSGSYIREEQDRKLFIIPVMILLIPCTIVDKLYGFDYCYLNGGNGTFFENISSKMPLACFIVLLYSLIFFGARLIFFRKSKLQLKRRFRH